MVHKSYRTKSGGGGEGGRGMNVADEGLDDCEVGDDLQQRGQRGQPGPCDAAPTDGCQDFIRVFGLVPIFFNYQSGQMFTSVRRSMLAPPPF